MPRSEGMLASAHAENRRRRALACTRGRREARARAAAHLAAGNTAAALECYQRAVDVTPAMARQVGGWRAVGRPLLASGVAAVARGRGEARTAA
jgi:hypothetical protein